jgi:hypothetical protein
VVRCYDMDVEIRRICLYCISILTNLTSHCLSNINFYFPSLTFIGLIIATSRQMINQMNGDTLGQPCCIL